MTKYIFRRILLMIPTLLAIVLVVMIIFSLVPGTGVRTLATYSASGDWLDSVLTFLHWHGTFMGRYVRFLCDIFTGNFGDIRSTGVNTVIQISVRLKHTLIIAGSGILFSFIFGLPLGFTAAIYKGKKLDTGISTATLLISSIPSYCIAVICTLVFVVWLRILPLTGFKTPANFVNPAIVTAVPGIAVVTAITRSAVLRVLEEPYITVLRSEGMKQARILRVHIFRNSFVIFMSSFQNIAISILCSGMIAENFFSIPGLGVMLVEAVANRSAYLCLVCIVIFSILIMLISLLCDLACLAVDPRLRLQAVKGGK